MRTQATTLPTRAWGSNHLLERQPSGDAWSATAIAADLAFRARGKQLVLVIGTRQAVATAIRTETTQRRETLLVERLQGKLRVV